MPPAGYSGTPPAKKLGVGAGMSVAPVETPDDLPDLLDPVPAGVSFRAGCGVDPTSSFAS